MSAHAAADVELTVAAPHAADVAEVRRLLRVGGGRPDGGRRASPTCCRRAQPLPEPKRTPAWQRFLSHFNDTLIYILLAAAAIKAVMGDWLDFWVIVSVAVINAVIGYVQEGRAEKALAGIRGMLSADATVRREGRWTTVAASELVPATWCD